MGDSSMETGHVKIGRINSSLDVLRCGISVELKASKKLAPVAKVDFPPLQQDFKANIWGNGASEVVNSGSKLVFTSEVVL